MGGMIRSILLGALSALALTAGHAAAGTLEEVTARGELICGVNQGLAGFATVDATGNWSGFDVAYCQAVAATVLGDKTKVRYVPTTAGAAFGLLEKGEVDVLPRAALSFSNDAARGFTFVGVTYYDDEGVMVRKDLGATSVKELNGATICVQEGTSVQRNLADWFKANGMTYVEVRYDATADGDQKYRVAACDAYAGGLSALAASRAGFPDADSHIILPELLAKEPLGPVVRHGDDTWADINRWILNALIAAEEFGVTSANIDELAKGTPNAEIDRLLGSEGDLGQRLGLDAGWAVRAIKANGNYGEIFAVTIGEATPIALARGLNSPWTQGGLLYSPPFR